MLMVTSLMKSSQSLDRLAVSRWLERRIPHGLRTRPSGTDENGSERRMGKKKNTYLLLLLNPVLIRENPCPKAVYAVRGPFFGLPQLVVRQHQLARFELAVACRGDNHRCRRQVELADARPVVVERLRTAQRLGLQVPRVDDVVGRQVLLLRVQLVLQHCD